MRILNLKYLTSAAILLGGLAACSSNDSLDNIDVSKLSPQAVGVAMDDVTSEMSSSIWNRNEAGTRAKAELEAISSQIPQWPERLDTSIPSEYTKLTDASAANTPNTNYVVPANTEIDNLKLQMNGTKLFILGTVTMIDNYMNGWPQTPGSIIVKKGGKLILKRGTNRIFGNGGTLYVEEGGTLEIPKDNYLYINDGDNVYIQNGNLTADNIIVQGKLYVNGNVSSKDFSNGNPQYGNKMNSTTRLNVTGSLTCTDKDLWFDGYCHIGGNINAGEHGEHDIYFQNATHLLADCAITGNHVYANSNNTEIHVNYIKCKNFTHCAGAKVYLENGGLLDIDGDYINANNGNDAALIMEGENAMGVVKAGAIYYNGSTSTDAYFAKTPEDGQTLGVDCRSWNYIKTYNNWTNTVGSSETVIEDSIDFQNYNVDHITAGKKNISDGKSYSYSIDADNCHGGGYEPGKKTDEVIPSVISSSHTHDISATCVQYVPSYNNNVYVSYHQRGNDQSGCLEVFNTTGDVTTLKQFVRDHSKSIDFNHIALDTKANRLYTVGNNKNGGFIGYMRINDDGLLDCTSVKKDGLDSTEIIKGTYKPLVIRKLIEAQQAAKSSTHVAGGDGNCVIVNYPTSGGDPTLQVASTYGYETFNANLDETHATKTEGRAKHVAFSNMGTGDDVYAIHYDGTKIANEMTPVGLKLEKFAKTDYNMVSPTYSRNANQVHPNNGKNTICEYGGLVYVCQSMDGLYVYDAKDGSLVNHYKQNITNSKTGNEMKICVNGVAVDDKYVYVAYGSRGLVILDRSSLAKGQEPKKVGSFVDSHSANYVTVAGKYIYVAYGRDELKVFKLVEK